MVFATLILIVTILPVLFMEGLTGALFKPLAFAYALALLASMAVTLTFTLSLSMILLPHAPLKPRESPLVRWLRHVYDGILAPTVQRTSLAYLLVGVALLVGLVALPFLRPSLMPPFQEPDLVIKWEGAPGTSHSEMTRLTAEAIRALQAIPGVRSVNAHVGRAVLGDEVVGINSAELWVRLDPELDHEATVATIQETIDGYPGLVRNVQAYLGEIVGQVLTEASQAAFVRIYGPDLAVLRRSGQDVVDALAKIDGIVDLTMEAQAEEPHVEVEVDLASADRYGLIPGDVRRAAATLVAGLEVGSLFEGQKVFDVVLWSVPAARHSLTSLRELLIDTPGGGHVRLADVAELRVASTPNAISREANSRYLDVGFNVSERDLGSVASDVELVLQQVEFPLEYHPELISTHAERQATQNRTLGVVIVAVIGILLLLQAAFDSWRPAFLLFPAMLAAPAGGVLTTLVAGDTLSLGSLAGFLAVSAIFVRNGILLINHYQHLEQHEGETFGPELVIRGTRERLVPILMSATAVAFALLPFALFGNIPGHEIVHTMAVVALGGLFTATLVNLIVIPALYLRFGSSPEPVMST
jgi:Cu/Ag efflux pump CusA